jgi:Alcohol dehydrogenase GroES-like domain
MTMNIGCVLGHEGIGLVVAVGDAIKKCSAGDCIEIVLSCLLAGTFLKKLLWADRFQSLGSMVIVHHREVSNRVCDKNNEAEVNHTSWTDSIG